jgi:mycothiol synthase
MPDSIPQLVIHATTSERRAEVLRHLGLNPGQIANILDCHRRGVLDLNGLFHAERSGRVVGAAWGQILPGRMGYSWPASVVADEPTDTAHRLQQAADAFLDMSQVVLSQALVEEPQCPPARLLTQIGYHHLTDLDFLIYPLEQHATSRPKGEMVYETVGPKNRDRLAKIIQRTYDQTLDCPELDGLREIGDILEGYRHTGFYRPDWWLIARLGKQDIGCLLLTDHPEVEQCELVYMGLATEYRGQGRGLELTRHAQQLAAAVSRPRLTLAVDRVNWPARAVYAAAGFQLWGSRSVFVRRRPVGSQ